MFSRLSTSARCGRRPNPLPTAAFAALGWVLAVFLTLPMGMLVGRSVPRALAGLPSGQLPGQSDEESESWPKTEARHAPQFAGGGRARPAAGDRLRWPLAIESVHLAIRPARPPGNSESQGRNGTGGPLRC